MKKLECIFIILLFLISCYANFGPNSTTNDSIWRGETLPKVESSSINSAVVMINGDPALKTYATTTSYFGGGGSGTQSNPYIIQNIWLSIFAYKMDGISIINTRAYFVLRNCSIISPWPWQYQNAGYRFDNVSNGIIESSGVVGTPSEGMLGGTGNGYPTMFGVYITSSSHISINNFIASTFLSGSYDVYPFYYGIAMVTSQYITISNSKIQGYDAIVAETCDHITIEKNSITGPSGYYWSGLHTNYVNLYIGISLTNTQQTLLYENRIQNWVKAGIFLYNSHFNTIVENYIGIASGITDPSSPYYDDPQIIWETGGSSSNYYSKINSPVNQTIYEQSNPNSGYYSGGISAYFSGEGFDNIPNGPISTYLSSLGCTFGCYSSMWLYPQYTGDLYHPINIINNKSDSMGFNHAKVLSINKKVGDSRPSVISNSMAPYYALTSKVSGTIEFWLLVNGTGSNTITFFNVDNTIAMKFQVFNQQFSVWNGLSYNNISVLSFENNKWYRISMNVSEDASYGGFKNPYQYNFEIYDSVDSNPLYISSTFSFVNSNHLYNLTFSAEGNASLQQSLYVDAIGYSWSVLFRMAVNNLLGFSKMYGNSYQAGDNKQEGLVFEYNIQRDEMEVDYGTLNNGFNSFGYYLSKASDDFDYNSLPKAINGVQFLYSANGPSPNTFDYNIYSSMEDKDWIFIVPMPKDGSYKIQIVSSKLNDFSGNLWTSDIIFFSKYFDRGLQILHHYENNEVYPPGHILSPTEDLNVTETIRSYDWYNRDTWTTAYFSFKINNGAWQGPYLIGNGYGQFNISFIISKVNYNNLDTVYYYLTYSQFDSNNNHLCTYYLKNDLATTFRVNEARQLAFIKKISPIAYGLNLTYNVYYQSQLAIQVGSTVYNPFMDILSELVSLTFTNVSSILTGEYNVTSNEYLLDHLMNIDTSYISRSSNPSFSYTEGITSPYILPLGTSLIQGSTTIIIPIISFDYMMPGLNLSYTGDFVVLTYQGLEHWPNSPSHPYQTMNTFTDSNQKFILRYDSATGIMTYFEYLNDTVPLQTQKIVFALTNNNAYPINLQVDHREELISSGTTIIPQHLFSIIYDPPGDHSYGQISSGTTMTYSVSMSKSDMSTSTICLDDDWICGVGSFFGVSDIQTNTTIKTNSQDNTVSVTFSTTFTSSQDPDNANLIGHGNGDLYVGSGIVVNYYIFQQINYLVVNTPDLPNEQTDDLRLFNGTPYIGYTLAFNSTFEVLGAYLDQFGLSSLRKYNFFADNSLSPSERTYVEEIQNSPLLWTPTTSTDIVYSTSNTSSVSYSINIHSTSSEAFSFNSPATTLLSGLGSCVPEAGGFISGIFSSLQQMPGFEFAKPTDLTFTTVKTSSTEQNSQILAHLEDDDGNPIGQNDQFDIHIYRDLRYNSFGYIIVSQDTYTSNPYESGTRDRRPPTISIISSSKDFVHGLSHFQVAGFD